AAGRPGLPVRPSSQSAETPSAAAHSATSCAFGSRAPSPDKSCDTVERSTPTSRASPLCVTPFSAIARASRSRKRPARSRLSTIPFIWLENTHLLRNVNHIRNSQFLRGRVHWGSGEGAEMDTRWRTLLKAVLWNLLGLLTMSLVGLAMTGSVALGGAMAVANTAIGFVAY